MFQKEAKPLAFCFFLYVEKSFYFVTTKKIDTIAVENETFYDFIRTISIK